MYKKLLLVGISILSLFLQLIPIRAKAQTQGIENGGFQLIHADEFGVLVEYRLGKYAIEPVELDGEIYDRIRLEDGAGIGEPQKPNLPLVSTAIGVPLNAEFSLRIEEVQTRPEAGRYRIEPVPTIVAGEEDLALGKVVYLPDEQTYASSEPYPSVFADLGMPAKLRDQRILPIRVYPFRYSPATGEIEVVTKIRLMVEYRYPQGAPLLDATPAAADEANPFEAIYQQSLLNYQEAKRYRAFEANPQFPQQYLSEESSSERYKITVTEDGIYRLTYENLKQAGMAVDSVNPQTFAMTNQGRPVAIFLQENDGNPQKFSAGEALLFFGEKFDGSYLASLYGDEDDFWRNSFYRSGESNLTPFTPRFNHYMVEKYTNENVYWLTYGTTGGPFMETLLVSAGSGSFKESFPQRLRYEQQNYWWTTHFTNEDTFFWDNVQFSSTLQKDYTLDVPNPTQNGNAILRGELVARAHNPNVNPDHDQFLSINGQQIGEITWDGLKRYRFELPFPASYLNNGQNTLTIKFQKLAGMTVDQIFVDWFELSFEQGLIAQQNQILINSSLKSEVTPAPNSLYKIYLPLILKDHPQISAYRIGGFSGQPLAFQINDPLKPKILNGGSYASGSYTFQISTDAGNRFIVALPKSPLRVEKVSDSNISAPRADYLFIAPREFLSGTQALADYRKTKDGLSTKVVALEDIINQYNFGIYHPRAIKNYLQDVYSHWSPKPQYVLLVGDGHWNFLNSPQYDSIPIYIPPNLQWVDPWQGEIDSANDLVTLEGWDPLPDLYIGRLPVNSNAEVLAYLNKVQTYENSLGQAWQKRFVFVTDANDPAAGNFPSLMDNVIASYAISDLRKIYLNKTGSSYTSYHTETQNNLPCGSASGANQCPNATQTLLSLLNTTLNTTAVGHLVYSGHGYIDGWSKAVVFSNQDLGNLTNSNLPIALTLDCLDGYWYYPKSSTADHRGQSLIESLIRAANRGIVAAFSPTGLGVATAHDQLQRGFYDKIFEGSTWRLGEASVSAKLRVYNNSLLNVDLVHTYTIFGDPALRSPSPKP